MLSSGIDVVVRTDRFVQRATTANTLNSVLPFDAALRISAASSTPWDTWRGHAGARWARAGFYDADSRAALRQSTCRRASQTPSWEQDGDVDCRHVRHASRVVKTPAAIAALAWPRPRIPRACSIRTDNVVATSNVATIRRIRQFVARVRNDPYDTRMIPLAEHQLPGLALHRPQCRRHGDTPSAAISPFWGHRRGLDLGPVRNSGWEYCAWRPKDWRDEEQTAVRNKTPGVILTARPCDGGQDAASGTSRRSACPPIVDGHGSSAQSWSGRRESRMAFQPITTG